MTEQTVFSLSRGDSPLLVSMPHVGTRVPAAITQRMTDRAAALPDTDWYVDQLYDFLGELDVSTIKAQYSRFVVDLNRDPDGASLYPGQNVTEICPTTLFDEQPIYQPGEEPQEQEVANRVGLYWAPYHRQIAAELQRIRDKYGYAVLLDAHSIMSRVPRFFEGRLPDFNWGTAEGATCDAILAERLLACSMADSAYSAVLNGRFKGGYITRNYGKPDQGVQAIQLELSQATYMGDELAHQLDEVKLQQVQTKLRALVERMLDYADSLGG